MDQGLPRFGNQDLSPQSRSNVTYVYSWGKNKNGELSIGNLKQSSVPRAVRGVQKQEIISLSSGSEHSALVTTEGKLFVCGSTLHGKLGLEEQNQPYYPKLQPVTSLNGLFVKQVSCGDYHTMCLMETGEVYAWGGTLHKKLGQRAGRPAPIQALQGKFIVQIDCGDWHSAALTQNGELYTWGGGGRDFNKGQLGHGHLNDVEQPEKVKFANDVLIRAFSCGGYHMMALDDLGQLWSWGQGMYGETGQGEFQDSVLPKKVQINFNQKSIIVEDLYKQKDQKNLIIDIKCGGHHSLILTNKGTIYSCGFAQYGQLGIKTKENQSKFQLVVGLIGKDVIAIAAGWNHSVALTTNRDIYTCGHNAAGQLGVADEESRTVFTHVASLAGKNIQKIFAGGSHTWALLDYDQPDLAQYKPPSPIKEEPNIQIQQIENESNNNNQQNERVVEVITSDIDLCHRFVRITAPVSHEQIVNQRMSEYSQQMQRDQSVKLVRIQSDVQATGTQDNGLTTSFTIMIVQELTTADDDIETFPKGSMTVIGQQFLAKVQGLRWHWVVQGERLFSQYKVKYFEIRPKVN